MTRSYCMFIGLFATVFGHSGYAQSELALYVARSVWVAPQARESYLACLQNKAVPVWRDLRKQGMLTGESVYETTQVRGSEKGAPEWTFLLLSHVASSATPQSYLAAEDDRLGPSPNSSRCADVANASALRLEVLRTTPNSYYPRVSEEDDREALKEHVSYDIEYIAVQDRRAALDQYRDNMRTYLGPAIGLMIDRKALFSFVGLETVSVLYARPGMPNWNQIHLSGRIPEDGEKFRTTLEAASRQVDPKRTAEGDAALLNRLRTRPRIDTARKLYELSVH
jgi:hypothetical protein